MKFFIVFSAVVACALARPGYLHVPHVYAAPQVYTPLASQYQAQDALGQYTYGYNDGFSTKVESRSFDGITRGGYSYVDSNGAVQNVQYTADDVNGFRVAASNLPKAPKAPEVVEQDAPKPVEDTPEVAQAKSDHTAAVEEIKTRDAAISAADSEAVEVGSHVVAPVVPSVVSYAHPAAYYGYSAPFYTGAYHHVAPVVHAYSYTPVLYSGGHLANELPTDDRLPNLYKDTDANTAGTNKLQEC
ncbi:Cuticular protein 72Ea [Carabus blaptoides fortunei]